MLTAPNANLVTTEGPQALRDAWVNTLGIRKGEVPFYPEIGTLLPDQIGRPGSPEVLATLNIEVIDAGKQVDITTTQVTSETADGSVYVQAKGIGDKGHKFDLEARFGN